MSSAKVVSVLGFVMSLTVAASLKLAPSQTAVTKQGAAVLFFASFQGSLREIDYNPVIFNEVLVNQGSGYSNVSGIFTAPFAGIYQFVFAAQLCRGSHNNVWYFMVQEERRMACHAQVSGGDTTLNTCYLMAELRKGDQAWIRQITGSCAWASTISRTITFSGVLLASEGVSTLGAKYGSGNSCPVPNVGGNRLALSSSAGHSEALSSVVIALLLSCLLFHSLWPSYQ